MHLEEMLYLLEPDKLMEMGYYKVALEKLRVLQKAHPTDKAIKKKVKKCRAIVEGNVLTRLFRAF